MAIDRAENTVLVTGGSGFVARWTIVALLQRGYCVQTTVRSLVQAEGVRESIAKQTEVGDRLSFFVADLLNDADWHAAVAGCDYILHLASPTPVGAYSAPDAIFYERGATRTLLEAGLRSGARRIVMTSSLQAALPAKGQYLNKPSREDLWTDLSAEGVDDFTKAKTMAERDAWEFVEQRNAMTKLTTILPASIVGPELASRSGSDYAGLTDLIHRMITGRVTSLPRIGFNVVDVRDLADLYVRAMELEAAAGQRIGASGGFMWAEDIAYTLRQHFGAHASKIPTHVSRDLVVKLRALVDSRIRRLVPHLGQKRMFSADKALNMLDWHPRFWGQTVVDTTIDLTKDGLANIAA